MELPSKLLEQIAFKTRPEIEEHMLVVMDNSFHAEHLHHPLQTNDKQFKIAVTFLTGYNGIFNVTNANNKFYFKKTISNEENFIQITIPPGAYETESLNMEIKTIVIDKGHYSENEYPFTIKPNFRTLGSIVEIKPQGPIISFEFEDIIRSLLAFKETILYKEHNESTNPVDIISFDNIFIETDRAQGRIFKGKRSGIIINFTMPVSPGYKFSNKFEGGVQWYMMDIKDFISRISFKLKNEGNELLSFNGQSITFRLSIKEIYFTFYGKDFN